MTTYGVLPADSPAASAADAMQSPSDDILGQPRDGAPDLGAFEVPSCVLEGDLDGDGDLDVGDIVRVAGRWRLTEGDAAWDARYDLDGDGEISVLEIIRVAMHWGELCDTGGDTSVLGWMD